MSGQIEAVGKLAGRDENGFTPKVALSVRRFDENGDRDREFRSIQRRAHRARVQAEQAAERQS